MLDWPQSAALSVALLAVVLAMLSGSMLAVRRYLPRGR